MSAPFAWLYVCFAAGSWFALSWNTPYWLLAPVAGLTVTALFVRSFRLAVLIQLIFFFVMGSALLELQKEQYSKNTLRKAVAAAEQQTVAVRARILQTPEMAPDFFVLKVRVLSFAGTSVDGVARLTVSGTLAAKLVSGDVFDTFARFRLPSNFETPGSFDYKRYLQKEGVHVLGSVKNEALIHTISRETSLRSLISSLRYTFLHSIDRAFSVRDAAALRALWLDDRSALDRESQQTLIDAGIFHVIAISGFHIAVLIAICFALLKHVISYRKALVFISALLAFYFLLLEGRSSITRSFLTFLIFSFASWKHERVQWKNVLFLSAFAQIVLNPLELFDPGYHLTYLSTAAIVFLAAPLSRYFRQFRSLYQAALLFVITSVSIQFLLAPYQAYIFHKIPFSGLLANFVAIPVSGVLIGAGVLLPFVPPLAGFIRYMVHNLLTIFFNASSLFSGLWLLPLAEPPLFIVALFYISIGAAIFARKNMPRALAAAASIICLCFIFWPQEGAQPHGLRVHFIDVGQGDSILLQYPDGTADLVDGGGFWNPEALDIGTSVLFPYLSHLHVRRIHRVFLTHAHADHMEGLITLLKYVPVDNFYVSRKPLAEYGFQHLVRSVSLPLKSICSGEQFQQGDVKISVLAPADAGNSLHVRNDDSLVLLVSYAGKNLLLPGDAERATESSLSELVNLHADFLKAAHHGSKTSSSEHFLQQIKPSVAFISVGKGNWFGHPSAEVLERYKRHHMIVYRTDHDGTLVLSINKNSDFSIEGAAWMR